MDDIEDSTVAYVAFDQFDDTLSPDLTAGSPPSRLNSISTISTNAEISLFPYLDKLLLYSPTHITKNRNRILNFIIICLFCLTTIQMVSMTISAYMIYPETFTMTGVTGKFTLCLFVFPYGVSALRLWFFTRNFTFDIWHYKPSMDSLSTKFDTSISYLLQQPSNMKGKIRKKLRIAVVIVYALQLVSFILYVKIQFFYASHLKPKGSEKGSSHSTIFLIYFDLMYYIFILIPDCAMMVVVRIYFTECHLQIKVYTDALSVITSFSSSTSSYLDDLITFDMHNRYLKMHDRVTSMTREITPFVWTEVVSMTFLVWYFIGLFFYGNASSVASSYKAYEHLLMGNFACLSVLVSIQCFLMLWPAFRMTELFNELKVKVNDEMALLLETRTYLNDEKILNGLTHGIKNIGFSNNKRKKIQNKNNNIGDSLDKYSKEKACIELIFQLLRTIKDKPCSFQLLGLELDRYSIRDFIIAILCGKIVGYLWSEIVLED